MRFNEVQTLDTLAKFLGARSVGPSDFKVYGTGEIHRVGEGEIVFVNHPKYYQKALESSASVVLIDKEVEVPEGKALLISEDPFRDFNRINTHFSPYKFSEGTSSEPVVGEGTQIHASAIIGNFVTIGKDCQIHAGAIIGEGTIIGDRVIIGAGTVLGGEAFYYRKLADRHDRLVSVGNVVVEDDVEIGVSCTIDRGVTHSTTIGKGSVLDNQIQLGHDTILGNKVLIAAQTGIAGCCDIGDEVTIWGQVGMASGVHIEKGTVILAQCGVNRSLTKGTYFGPLATEFKEYLRKEVKLKNLK